MSAWGEAKTSRYVQTEGRCEVCGLFITGRVIGHHKHNRSKDGPDTPDNCELRCQECETFCHQKFPEGNVPSYLRWYVMHLMEESKMQSNYEHDCQQRTVCRTLAVTNKVRELQEKGLGDKEIMHALLLTRDSMEFHKSVIAGH